MRISIIGSGNIAYFFADCFRKSGFEISEIWNRDVEKGKALAEFADALYVDNINNLRTDVDVFIIAVKDDVIKEMVLQLPINEALIIHTAGSVSLDVLSSLTKRSGVIWPVYSINKNHLPKENNIPLLLEGSDYESLETVRQLAHAISHSFWVTNFEQRQKLHLAAVMSNNFINHLLALAELNCQEQNLPFEILKPIIDQTFENAFHFSAKNSQTGPAIRNDEKTMQQHLKILQQSEEQVKIYKAISASIQKTHKK